MNGIFGVGLAEVLIVGLALFIVGGPKNTAKWAREMGRMVRKAREAWAEVMAEIENELGPEGKELMDTARELGKGARQMSNMSPTKRVMGETLKMVSDAVDISEADKKPAPASSNGTTGDKKYSAWIPPDDQAE